MDQEHRRIQSGSKLLFLCWGPACGTFVFLSPFPCCFFSDITRAWHWRVGSYWLGWIGSCLVGRGAIGRVSCCQASWRLRKRTGWQQNDGIFRWLWVTERIKDTCAWKVLLGGVAWVGGEATCCHNYLEPHQPGTVDRFWHGNSIVRIGYSLHFFEYYYYHSSLLFTSTFSIVLV